MAIVQAGKQFSNIQLKDAAGATATAIRDSIQNGMDLKVQLESWPDADLIELGLTQPEIDAMKGFFVGDLPALATQLQASTWLKQLLGLGV
jgi:hypothetical protein